MTLSLMGKTRYTFNVAIDMLTQCLRNRLDAYRHLRSLFDVLFCATSRQSDASVLEKAKTLENAYPSDLNDNLGDEFIQLRKYVKPEDDTSPQGLMRMITDWPATHVPKCAHSPTDLSQLSQK